MTLIEFNKILIDYDLSIYKHNTRGNGNKVILITDIEYTPAFIYGNIYLPFFVIDVNTKNVIQIKLNNGNTYNAYKV